MNRTCTPPPDLKCCIPRPLALDVAQEAAARRAAKAFPAYDWAPDDARYARATSGGTAGAVADQR